MKISDQLTETMYVSAFNEGPSALSATIEYCCIDAYKGAENWLYDCHM